MVATLIVLGAGAVIFAALHREGVTGASALPIILTAILGMVWWGGVAVYCRKKAPPEWLSWFNATVESSFGTAGMLLDSELGVDLALTSPALLIYPLAITTSALRLVPAMPIYSAVLSSAQLLVMVALIGESERGFVTLGIDFFAIRAALFLMVGLAGMRIAMALQVMVTQIIEEAQERVRIRDALDQQAEEFRRIKRIFGRYVSNDVVETLTEHPDKLKLGGELRDVTILFADIRGYSTLSEALAPTEIIALLNHYFQAVTKVILDQRGMINEFEGDAVLAVYGAPLDLASHAECALVAAIGMLAAVDELNQEWEESGTLEKWRAVGMDGLAIRIGVHSGPVVAGNIGSEQRTKYAVIGDTVNTCSRVEGLNKVLKTDLLVTESTVAALTSDALKALMIPLGSHVVKGRTEPVEVYTIDRDKASAALASLASSASLAPLDPATASIR